MNSKSTHWSLASARLLAPLAVMLPADVDRASHVSASTEDGPGPTAHNTEFLEAPGKVPHSLEVKQLDQRLKFLTRGTDYTLSLTSGEGVLALRDLPEPEVGRVLRMKLAGALPRGGRR